MGCGCTFCPCSWNGEEQASAAAASGAPWRPGQIQRKPPACWKAPYRVQRPGGAQAGGWGGPGLAHANLQLDGRHNSCLRLKGSTGRLSGAPGWPQRLVGPVDGSGDEYSAPTTVDPLLSFLAVEVQPAGIGSWIRSQEARGGAVPCFAPATSFSTISRSSSAQISADGPAAGSGLLRH